MARNTLKLFLLFLIIFSSFGYVQAQSGPPPPSSEKLPIPGIAYLILAGLFYGYKKIKE